MALRAAVIATFVVLLGIITTSIAQDQCGADVYCGHVCCTQDSQRCCATATNRTSSADVCCSPADSNVVGSCNGGTITCPNSVAEGDVYDISVNPAQLRNQCCVYFRDGCCSASENTFLDLLFKLAIGLGIGLGGLVLIIIILVVCCCCCICCD